MDSASEVNGLFKGAGKNAGGEKAGALNRAMPLMLILMLLLLLIPILLLVLPSLMIGTIDFNLQDAVGFTSTAAVIEEQGVNITEELAKNGELPKGFFGDLADAGILVGQVTASGDFVQTNRYIANLGDDVEVAASGIDYYKHGKDGELAFLFEDEVVDADEFVETVHSNPRLYASFAKALDVTARFYYGGDVDTIYRELGIARGFFNEWEVTGDNDTDMENFYKLLDEALDIKIDVDMAGCNDDSDCSDAKLKTGEKTNVEDVSNKAGGTEQATQLLNSAISANEPRQAARAFMAVEEPIQRARAEGDGPVNQLMNALLAKSEVPYTDVNTGEKKVTKKSILDTRNFVAAVSNGKYSIEEANNYSRDRVLIATDTTDNAYITDTTVDDTNKSSGVVLKKGNGGADPATLEKASGSVDLATMVFNNIVFTSEVGGNRILEGGSYLSNLINQRSLGAMPSDADTVANYQREVDVMVARRNEAERATLSPFDISSPNTFLGSIAHGFAKAYIGRDLGGEGKSNLVSLVGATVDFAENSVNDLFGTALADGDNQKFTTLAGDCSTVSRAGNVIGDIYCNSHNTLTTKYIGRTKSEWDSVMAGQVSDDQGDRTAFSNYLIYGTERGATVGVRSAEVCEAYKEVNDSGWFDRVRDAISKLFRTYDACKSVDESIATGLAYTLSSSNSNRAEVEKYSGYVLYDTVYALIQQSQSSVSAYKEEYYKRHPRDNSVTGQIARMSGMTKQEAELAMSYASYLNFIAYYDASDRYAFGSAMFEMKDGLVFNDVNELTAIGAVLLDKISFADVRNRTFAV